MSCAASWLIPGYAQLHTSLPKGRAGCVGASDCANFKIQPKTACATAFSILVRPFSSFQWSFTEATLSRLSFAISRLCLGHIYTKRTRACSTSLQPSVAGTGSCGIQPVSHGRLAVALGVQILRILKLIRRRLPEAKWIWHGGGQARQDLTNFT